MTSKSQGNDGETLVLNWLFSMGFVGELNHQGWHIVRGARGRVIGALPKRGKKLGDILGLWNGRFLCVEVKSHDDDTLPYSQFSDHQPALMDKWQANGGTSVLAWVRGNSFKWMQWVDVRPLIKPGTSLKWSLDAGEVYHVR